MEEANIMDSNVQYTNLMIFTYRSLLQVLSVACTHIPLRLLSLNLLLDRSFTVTNAKDLNLTGYVKNMSDGTVSAEMR